jgi:hypothetical protein
MCLVVGAGFAVARPFTAGDVEGIRNTNPDPGLNQEDLVQTHNQHKEDAVPSELL